MLPDYYLQRPDINQDNTSDFEQLYDDMMSNPTMELSYRLNAPKWQFLCYLADTKDILLHGSANPSIEVFEPRKSTDSDEFGNQCAIYAASDGIWPLYFAVVDRESVTSLVNSCFRVSRPEGPLGPYYYFSVDKEALSSYPWRNGTIYILPKDTFHHQPGREVRGMDIEFSQWASSVPVKPLAKLAVTPEDFPFIYQVNGHDRERVAERASRNPDDFPWRD